MKTTIEYAIWNSLREDIADNQRWTDVDEAVAACKDRNAYAKRLHNPQIYKVVQIETTLTLLE